MTYEINETHDPNLKSWVESANDPNTDFPIQNLPFCLFRVEGERSQPPGGFVGVLIGDFVLNLDKAVGDGLFEHLFESNEPDRHMGLIYYGSLNGFFRLKPENRRAIRRSLVELLCDQASEENRSNILKWLVPRAEAQFARVPAFIGDYTDFYCSIYHATNVGSMFRPDAPLLPNYKYVPIGYHGRASSIVVSGTDVKRPHGQNRSDAEAPPVFMPCKNLDYEMELGFFVGQGNEQGTPVAIGEAEQHIFGMCLVNDWSARDIQAWEYQPLGPFLAKNFATTISPFVVTMEALAPFRTPAFEREEGDPQPLD
ncbi:MAG: fumarylacetoacetate hydrolase family protein, partial [Acidobacteriota bacterium]